MLLVLIRSVPNEYLQYTFHGEISKIFVDTCTLVIENGIGKVIRHTLVQDGYHCLQTVKEKQLRKAIRHA